MDEQLPPPNNLRHRTHVLQLRYIISVGNQHGPNGIAMHADYKRNGLKQIETLKGGMLSVCLSVCLYI